MSDKFIPDGHSDFALMARNFATAIVKDPQKYNLSAKEAQEIMAKVVAYRDAMVADYNRNTRCRATRMRKDQARLDAELLIRDAGNRIRHNRQICAADKIVVHIKGRPTRLKQRQCPQTPPRLLFDGATPASNAIEGKHIIRFFDDWGKQSLAKPQGAVRMELFVDLVPPGEPIPTWPGERWGGRMWYLRSFTRSPAEVDYPRSDEPMRVVYWARWAGAKGDTGPFSKTLATRVEGFDRALPQPGNGIGAAHNRQTVIITTVHRHLPTTIEGMTQTDAGEDVKLLGNNIADAA